MTTARNRRPSSGGGMTSIVCFNKQRRQSRLCRLSRGGHRRPRRLSSDLSIRLLILLRGLSILTLSPRCLPFGGLLARSRYLELSPRTTHNPIPLVFPWGAMCVEGHSNKHAPRHIPEAQGAFKILMIHWILQVARRIAVRCVLHRCGSQDIRR